MQTFHHYILHEELGRGTNSVVYTAEHRQTQQKVALKLYPPDFANDPIKMGVFEQRIETLNQIDHAAVVPVYDSGIVSSLPYLALPLMEGGSLRGRLDRLQGEPMPIEEIQLILNRVIPALDTLHQHGIVHADLTPDSIVFDELGLPYVGGIEVIGTEDVGALTLLRENNLNPHYLAPEQVQRQPVSPQTDIYALSAILYEMLAGRPPYSGGTPLSIAYQHVNDPIPEIETQGLVSADYERLNRLVARGLAKNPAERPDRAQQLLDQFVEIVGETAVKYVAPNPAPVALNGPPPIIEPSEPEEVEEGEPAEPETDQSFGTDDAESDYFDPEGGSEPSSRLVIMGMFGLTLLCMVGILGVSFVGYLIRDRAPDNPVVFPTLAPSTSDGDGGVTPEAVVIEDITSGEPVAWDDLTPIRGDVNDGLFPDLGENRFTAEEAGWHIYANANTVRDAIYVDGVIYMASANGVVVFDTAAGTETHLTVFDGLPSSDTRAVMLCNVPQRRVVIGTSSGTALIDPAVPNQVADVWVFGENDVARNNIRSLACSPEGAAPMLYLGHDSSGVSILNVESGRWQRITESGHGLADDTADDLAASADTLWIGHDIYLSSYDLATRSVTEHDPETSDVPTDWPDGIDVAADGTMWMITLDGLVRGDTAGNWMLYSDEDDAYNLPLSVGNALHVDSEGMVWIGYSGGRICRFDPAAERCSDPYQIIGGQGIDQDITSIDTTPEGDILVGTVLSGVRLGQIETIGEWRAFELEGQLPFNGMTALAESGDYMWIGTERGLYRAPLGDLSGGNWAAYSGNDTPLPRTWITTLLADGAGGVWVGTPSGLAHVTADYEIWSFLTDFEIDALAFDDQNRLWIGTGDGVFLWNGAEMTDLGGWRGLPDEDVESMIWHDGEMWVAYDSDYVAAVDGDAVTVISDEDTDHYFFALHDMAVTDDGLILANGSELLSVEGESVSETADLDSIVEALYYHEPSDTLFIGTWRGGLVLQGETEQVIGPEFGIPDFYVADVMVDSLGTVWIVGDGLEIDGGGGIARYVPGD